MDTRSSYILRNESFEIDNPDISVETVSDDVKITESLDAKCYVEISARSENAKQLADLIDITATGKKLLIRVGRRSGGLRQLFSGHSNDFNIIVKLPKIATLKIKTVSSDVEVNQSVRNLDVNSVSGDVSVLQNPTEICTLKTVSGDITTRTFSGCHYSLRSVSGDITVHVAPGLEIDVDGKSISGDIESEISLNSTSDSPVAGSEIVVITSNTISGDFVLARN